MRVRVLEFIRSRRGWWNLPDVERERLRARFPGVHFDSPERSDDVDRLLPEADVVLGPAVRPANLASARRLRWIHAVSAGLDHLLFPQLVGSDITLTNARGIHDDAMAEHALAVMLSFARQLHRARDLQQRAEWGRAELAGRAPGFRSLAGSTLGIVGFGSIGRSLGCRGRALGMTVLGVRRRPGGDAWPAHRLWGLDRLDELLAASDWVVVALPLTSDTRGMLDRERLARLKPGAHVVNIGRGPTIDEPALIEALAAGRIPGAAPDVFCAEPVPADSPWWRLESAIVTPHVSGFGPDYWPRLLDQFAANLARFLAAEPLANVVDKRAGY